MSEKITLLIQHEANGSQKKFKNLEFVVKIVLKNIPQTAEEMEEVLSKNAAILTLEHSLKDILLHNENITEYARLYRGDSESEANKRNIVRHVDFELSGPGVKIKDQIKIEDGSFHKDTSVRSLLSSLMKKIKSVEITQDASA